LITPTDACLGFLDPGRISKIDFESMHVAGDKPSKTLQLHRHIYSVCDELNKPTRCVIHTHSTYCVATSLDATGAELLPPLTPYFVMKVGHVPLLPYRRPGHPDLGPLIREQIRHWAERGVFLRAVMHPRLGPNVWHESPGHAMATLEELEETAKLWHLNRPSAAPLGAEEIEDLRRAFGAAW
jgi:ribulose-5-phosphate 4-epimerase/fuculose-1-phosphate aldolase